MNLILIIRKHEARYLESIGFKYADHGRNVTYDADLNKSKSKKPKYYIANKEKVIKALEKYRVSKLVK